MEVMSSLDQEYDLWFQVRIGQRKHVLDLVTPSNNLLQLSCNFVPHNDGIVNEVGRRLLRRRRRRRRYLGGRCSWLR